MNRLQGRRADFNLITIPTEKGDQGDCKMTAKHWNYFQASAQTFRMIQVFHMF